MIASLSKRRLALGALTLVGSLLTSAALAQTGSLAEARQAAEARDQARLETLLNDQQALDQALEQARTDNAEAQTLQQTLAEQQQAQAEQAQTLASRQSEQGDELSSLLSALTRQSDEVRNQLGQQSLLTLGETNLPPRLDGVDILERTQLEEVVDSLAGLSMASGRAERLTLPVADAGGEIETRDIVRLGDFAAFTDTALLRVEEESGAVSERPRTPDEIERVLGDYFHGESRQFAIDPSQGSVLAALTQQPSLWERFQQGGYVGYVVAMLGIIGLLVALAQYLYLWVVSARVRRQRRTLDAPKDDNPLGRVLNRFKEMDKHQTPEALEARLDEAVLAELPRIERGQPMVKLLAAIAPLLGLLGTVSGMIVTFQAITVFGTGDPQLMAGGISQALVTTVLGLVTAVPLLFAQTALSSRSRYLTQVIEGEASATLADHLEAQTAHRGAVVS
ncbi:MotA/TolQ/ExbB proton channel family protein [Halomonas sp. HNIBRBA4712]|uniref:MotA/TolQ/ExbB proton channel family protein n=1 Tax=Halomonas sp. HNIBRBA4712 TaxID=3373087 RepID=UPI003746E55F